MSNLVLLFWPAGAGQLEPAFVSLGLGIASLILMIVLGTVFKKTRIVYSTILAVFATALIIISVFYFGLTEVAITNISKFASAAGAFTIGFTIVISLGLASRKIESYKKFLAVYYIFMAAYLLLLLFV